MLRLLLNKDNLMFKKQYRSYQFGSLSELSQTTLNHLILVFNSKKIENPRPILTGRNSVVQINIDKVGPVIVKSYTRGGFVSYFNKQRYFFSNKKRNMREFEFLLLAQKASVNVPKPFAYASYGSLFYKAWLITERIDNAQNYVELCLRDEKKAITLLPVICDNINKLIDRSIFHVDLHPGNIVIDDTNKVFILDFDKACFLSGNRAKLKKKYIQRWQRAIEKYEFSNKLSQLSL